MADWQPMSSAPKDGTWIKVRGRDYGIPGNRRHYAIAFYDDGAWQEIGSNAGQLQYLTDWKPMNDPVGHVSTPEVKP
jgi:hypothetical protein